VGFFNVFNRTVLSMPSSGNITTPQTLAISGFGRVNPASVGHPAQARLVARVTFDTIQRGVAMHKTMGGSLMYSADGKVLASANREGREEILYHDLETETALGSGLACQVCRHTS
jgi:predicted amidohydrolase